MTSSERRDTWLVSTIAFLARAGVVVWAATRIPPAADGIYYEKLAERLAAGQGYTWAWPDGVVTYAAHYPVGYPAMLSIVYRIFGARPWAGMALNMVLGVLGVMAAHALARRAMPERAALIGGLVAALDPALVAYTPAIMTEGVTASLLTISVFLAAFVRDARGRTRTAAWITLVLTLGLTTLVRPQTLLLTPFLGLLACDVDTTFVRKATASIATTLGSLLIVLPWTLRNCAHMGRCALVSVNGGWNLLIGAAPTSTGQWSPVDVPEACRNVFDEAAKDVCFGDAARDMITHDPMRWLRLVPAKLSATFDYAGAAPWYLHEANPAAFPWSAKMTLAGFETVVHRVTLVAVLLGLGWWRGPHARARKVIAAIGCVGALWAATGLGHRGGDVAHLAIVAVVLAFGRALFELPVLPLATAVVILGTALVHAAFFGAGRYGLVAFPLVSALSGALLTELSAKGDTSRHAAD